MKSLWIADIHDLGKSGKTHCSLSRKTIPLFEMISQLIQIYKRAK